MIKKRIGISAYIISSDAEFSGSLFMSVSSLSVSGTVSHLCFGIRFCRDIVKLLPVCDTEDRKAGLPQNSFRGLTVTAVCLYAVSAAV